MIKYGVWAIPPTKGLMSGLKPRFQIQNDKIVEYDDFKKALRQVVLCNLEYAQGSYKWRYMVKEIEG